MSKRSREDHRRLVDSSSRLYDREESYYRSSHSNTRVPPYRLPTLKRSEPHRNEPRLEGEPSRSRDQRSKPADSRQTSSRTTNAEPTCELIEAPRRLVLKGGVKTLNNMYSAMYCDPIVTFGSQAYNDSNIWQDKIVPALKTNKINPAEAKMQQLLLSLYSNLVPIGICGKSAYEGIDILHKISNDGSRDINGIFDLLKDKDNIADIEKAKTILGRIIATMPGHIIHSVINIEDTKNSKKNIKTDDADKLIGGYISKYKSLITNDVYNILSNVEMLESLENEQKNLKSEIERKKNYLEKIRNENRALAASNENRSLLQEYQNTLRVSTGGSNVVKIQNEINTIAESVKASSDQLSRHQANLNDITNLLSKYFETSSILKQALGEK